MSDRGGGAGSRDRLTDLNIHSARTHPPEIIREPGPVPRQERGLDWDWRRLEFVDKVFTAVE